MLHEILVALWGCSTSAKEIIEADASVIGKYLHPGECAIIKKILSIVDECNTVRKFIKTCSSVDHDWSNYNESERYKYGLYIRALCDGMDESLEPFRQDIVNMEQTILNDAYTPVSAILCCVQKHVCLFYNLNSIIREIQTQNLYGCKLLQCLHRRCHTGIPEVKTALDKMAYCLHTVFYKQLTSWLLYGQLEDTYKEFFIQKTKDISGGISTNQDTSVMCDERNTLKDSHNEMWDYDIQIDMLPTYIRLAIASKILTIGQTIIMFSNDSRHKKDFSCNSKMENTIWGEKEYEYFKKLQYLQEKPVFIVMDFEKTICEFKRCVEEHLWQVAVEEAQLMQQLKLLKEFYLMGRGDLYLEFIKLSAPILNKVPNSHTSQEINLAFQVALRKTQINDESATDSFTFRVSVPPDEPETEEKLDPGQISEKEREDPIEKRGWNLISLKYKVLWPLHLLFNPNTLQDYNTLFRFLLRVKKTQIDLWNLWTEHAHLQKIDMKLIQLRNTLIFIVDNLQYYLQVDVLESQYTIMENKMKNTRNFEDVQQAHSVFLANVLSQMFLSDSNLEKKNPVTKLLRLLLRLCDDFILQASVWEVNNLLAQEEQELKTLSEMLDDLMGWLTKTLNKVRAQSSGEHLAQLLLRLDFNRWFSNRM